METRKQYAYFSAAIRDGAKLRPQAYHEESGYGSCAIEAGCHAMTGVAETAYRLIERVYPYMGTALAPCPAISCKSDSWRDWSVPGRVGKLTSLCWHLNDYHNWSREHIADWLYAEEEKLGFVTLIEPEIQVATSNEVSVHATSR